MPPFHLQSKLKASTIALSGGRLWGGRGEGLGVEGGAARERMRRHLGAPSISEHLAFGGLSGVEFRMFLTRGFLGSVVAYL